MNMRVLVTIFALLTSLSAAGQTIVLISEIGAHTPANIGVSNRPNTVNQNRAYFYLSNLEAGVAHCPMFSFDITTAVGRAQYLALLTGKAMGKKITRIDYEVTSSDNYCTVYLLEIGTT